MDSSTYLLEFRTYQTERGLEAYADVPTLDVQLGGLPSWLDAHAAYIEVVAPTGEALVLKSRKGPPLGRIPQSREPADRAGCQYLSRIIQEEDGKRLAVKGESDAMEKLRSVMLVALPLLPGLHDALGRVLDACECRADALCRPCALISAMLSANPRVTLSSFPAPTPFTPRTEAELEVVEFRARSAGDEDVLALVAEVRAARAVATPAEVERARAAVASALETANIGWADEHLAQLAGVASMALALAQQMEALRPLAASREAQCSRLAEESTALRRQVTEAELRVRASNDLVATILRTPVPKGHSGDEESGQHDEDCEACLWESLHAMAEATQRQQAEDAPVPVVECPPCSKAGGADRGVFHEAPPCSTPAGLVDPTERVKHWALQGLRDFLNVDGACPFGQASTMSEAGLRALAARHFSAPVASRIQPLVLATKAEASDLDAAPPSRLIPLPLPNTPPMAPPADEPCPCGTAECGGTCQG